MNRPMFRFFLLAVALLGAVSSAAVADTWPSKPIRAIIPFGPGSAVDVVPRIVFEQMPSLREHAACFRADKRRQPQIGRRARLGDVVGQAGPAQGGLGGDELVHLRVVPHRAAAEVGFDGARRHHVDPDAAKSLLI